LRTTSDNKRTIDKISLMSGETKQKVKSLFESLISLIILDYMEGENTNIPFLGDIVLKYSENSKLSIDLKPESLLLSDIDEIVNGSGLSDIEKLIQQRIRESLRQYIQDDKTTIR